ncbi:MAG: hypothetical protein IPJ81_17005 [Chitinophagaceae bacterium]|nr:hypothetical protein [Chitinophagaceae bacterium]
MKRWWLVGKPTDPTEIHVEVLVKDAGRFAANINGRKANDQYAATIFSSIDEDQRMVKADEQFTQVFKLKKFNEGYADDIEIAFYLFDTDTDGNKIGEVRISKIFKKSISTEDDGSFFYGLLPPASTDTIH